MDYNGAPTMVPFRHRRLATLDNKLLLFLLFGLLCMLATQYNFSNAIQLQFPQLLEPRTHNHAQPLPFINMQLLNFLGLVILKPQLLCSRWGLGFNACDLCIQLTPCGRYCFALLGPATTSVFNYIVVIQLTPHNNCLFATDLVFGALAVPRVTVDCAKLKSYQNLASLFQRGLGRQTGFRAVPKRTSISSLGV